MASESKVTGVSGDGDKESCQEVDESQGGCEEDCEEEVSVLHGLLLCGAIRGTCHNSDQAGQRCPA
jgi:hypothetical protein